jgi:hypothetical protein
VLAPPGRQFRSFARVTGLVVWLLGLAVTVPAHADVPSAEARAEARRSEAKLRFDEGVNAFREHRYADAVEAFLKADALAASPALSFNIARAFERLDNPSSALRWYRDYRRRSPQAANAAEVEARISELGSKLAERGVQQLSVLSTPEGASVMIDDRGVGTTPVTLELPPGPHRLHVRLAGYADQQREFVLDPRTPQDIVLQLAPPPAATPSRPTESPVTEPRSTAAPRAPFGVAPWVVLGAGGVSFAAALSFELARRSAESEAEKASQRDYRVHYDAMRSRQTTARVLAGIGGALVVTGGVLLVLNKPRSPQVGAACTSDGCAALAQGSF